MPAAYTQRGPPVDSNSLHITQAVNTEHEMWAQLQNATVGLTGNFLANNTYGIRAAEIKRFKDARSEQIYNGCNFHFRSDKAFH